MVVENDSGRDIDYFYYCIDYVEMTDLPEGLGRFHAWYNHERTEASPEGENEWGLLGPMGSNLNGTDNYLIADVRGSGHFVGVNYYVHSPTPVWYGEGDEMFFIDGELWPPSLPGTGTEDYFNTAWAPKVLFSHPFFGYARVNQETGWLGRTHLYRFHITDPIYFTNSLRLSIEYGHNNNLTLDLASVAYWYQAEPHKSFPQLPSRLERRPRSLIEPHHLHLWRNEWRRNQGNSPLLWGDEGKPE